MFEKRFNLKISSVIRPDYRRLLKTGEYHLRLYVYQDPRNKKSYSTRIYVTPKEWEKINSPYNQPSVQAKKEAIIDLQARVNRIIRDLGDYFSFDEFEELMFGIKSKDKYDKTDVYATYQAKIDRLLENEQIGSVNFYQRSMESLRSYRKRLKFYQVTVDFLKGYERYMKRKQCSPSTIGIHLKHFRAIVNMALKEGVISSLDYPFGRQTHDKYEIPVSRTVKRALKNEELESFMQYEAINDEAWAKDMWLFSFYCNGMNMIDIFNLKWGNIKNGFLYFVREKTKYMCRNTTEIEIFLTNEAKEIIDRWAVGASRKKEDYIFGVFDEYMSAEEKAKANTIARRIVNNNMKRIGRKLEFTSRPTTYVARHTWATVLMKNNISMPYISKGLGHTSMTTTEKYLADFDQDQKIEVGGILSKIGKDKPKKKQYP